MNVVVFASVRSGSSELRRQLMLKLQCRFAIQDSPKPVSYSDTSLRRNSSSSSSSLTFGRPALRSAVNSCIRGSFLVIKTSAISALSDSSESGRGDESE